MAEAVKILHDVNIQKGPERPSADAIGARSIILVAPLPRIWPNDEYNEVVLHIKSVLIIFTLFCIVLTAKEATVALSHNK